MKYAHIFFLVLVQSFMCSNTSQNKTVEHYGDMNATTAVILGYSTSDNESNMSTSGRLNNGVNRTYSTALNRKITSDLIGNIYVISPHNEVIRAIRNIKCHGRFIDLVTI